MTSIINPKDFGKDGDIHSLDSMKNWNLLAIGGYLPGDEKPGGREKLADAPPSPTPVAPPPAVTTPEVKRKDEDLRSRSGFRGNLMTGGLGLDPIEQESLRKKKLGLS